METVTVGMIGSGFAAELHMHAYKRVYGVPVRVAAVASLGEQARSFAKRHGVDWVTEDYRDLLRDPSIRVIDIITPPYLHAGIVKEALKAGKHVICEKPLSGYFGKDGDSEPIGSQVRKSAMYESVLCELDELEELVASAEGRFMYAENFVYAPAVQKCSELLSARCNRILFMRGEESHSGSHADHAAYWKYAGGGSLIRQGCHPLSAILYLKGLESAMRGESIRVQSVTAETANVTNGLLADELRYIDARPVDVEDIALVNLRFSDGTVATVFSGDMVSGGVRNIIEMYTNDGVYTCNIAPNNSLMAFHADGAGLNDVYFTEKLSVKSGWQSIFLEEEVMRGYVGEMQDFMECVALGRAPKSGFQLARDTQKVVYAAYLSAESGCRVVL